MSLPTSNQINPMKFIDSMMRHSIGFDPYFFDRASEAPNFPPHTIEQLSEDHYVLTLAVAGFTEADLTITLHHDLLTIAGTRRQAEPEPGQEIKGYRMLYSGIAFRDFARQFKVGDHVNVENADLKDGLLRIDLVRRVPEEMKPRQIEIGRHAMKPPRLDG
jgi:molecular chaperone IbpA